MDDNLSYRILLAIVYFCITVFLSVSFKGCCDYDIKKTKVYVDGGFTRKMLIGNVASQWTKD